MDAGQDALPSSRSSSNGEAGAPAAGSSDQQPHKETQEKHEQEPQHQQQLASPDRAPHSPRPHAPGGHGGGGGGSLASRIAAFSSGVAPVRKGIVNAGEDSITVEEVLHKLEGASRAPGDGRAELPLPLVRSAYESLVAARDEAARVSKELAELKSSRVQLIPPSAWVKREHKYKMDQERYEHTISMQAQRVERLELELQLLREGSNVAPLEEKIQELETQLNAAAAEKTQVQSKYHELSIKHRQLIETSPQVATIWNEVLTQQQAAAGDEAAAQRLANFDLRHTGASSAMGMTGGGAAGATGGGAGGAAGGEPGLSPQRRMPGVTAATAIFSGGAAVMPPQQAGSPRGAPGVPCAAADAAELYPGTPVLSSGAAAPPPGSSAASSGAGAPPPPPQQPPAAAAAEPRSAEERANALMAAVALEGLSPEASLAALQQLNYDLTMQLGMYQQMVARLKDAMEQADLEKAELEADKMALEAQLMGAHMLSHSASEPAGRATRWSGLFWRRGATAEEEAEGSAADTHSLFGFGRDSFSSSRRSSGDFDSIAAAAGGGGGGSPPSAAARAAAAAAARDAAHTPTGDDDGDGAAAGPRWQVPADGGVSPTPRSAAPATSGLFAARRARAAARAAATADTLTREVKELRRQVASVQEENRFLVENLVEIKMELAETQSNHDQAKRALVRAMDKESCLDTKVAELTSILDWMTQPQQQQAAALSHIASAAAVAAGSAGAALAKVASDTAGTITAVVSGGGGGPSSEGGGGGLGGEQQLQLELEQLAAAAAAADGEGAAGAAGPTAAAAVGAAGGAGAGGGGEEPAPAAGPAPPAVESAGASTADAVPAEAVPAAPAAAEPAAAASLAAAPSPPAAAPGPAPAEAVAAAAVATPSAGPAAEHSPEAAGAPVPAPRQQQQQQETASTEPSPPPPPPAAAAQQPQQQEEPQQEQ